MSVSGKIYTTKKIPLLLGVLGGQISPLWDRLKILLELVGIPGGF